MRPKRVVLCVDSELELSLHRVRMESWGYQVLTASSEREALDVLDARAVDALVVGLDNGAALIESLWAMQPDLPTMLISRILRTSQMKDAATVKLGVGTNQPVYVREWVRILCSRKRGPKNGSVKVVRSRIRERLAA
jgi:CheY-like chemotaxis protein